MKPVARAFNRFLSAKVAHNQAVNAGRESKSTERAIWESVHAVVEAYAHAKSSDLSTGGRREAMPNDVAFFLAEKLGDGLAGKPFFPVVRRGAPTRGPVEISDIRSAVLYVKAARCGLLNDRAPQKTISDQYKIDLRTVKGWMKKFADVDVADFRPDFEYESDTGEGAKAVGFKPKELTPSTFTRGDLIRLLMEKSAQHYCEFGNTLDGRDLRDRAKRS